MAPLYKKALIIGATSGIGEALAAKLLENGTSVIVTGRRQDRLDAFTSAHSNTSTNASATAVAFDITQLRSIPSFAASIVEAHPDLDCLVLNAGVQRAFDFADPAAVDLAAFDAELATNYTAPVHLVTAFLPHLQKLSREGDGKSETHLVFVGASLALVPSLVRTPGYNASKAALHSWITNMRQQLKDAGDRVRVVEVFPPAVQTELHDAKHQPDLVNGGEIGMPLPAYTEQMYVGLEKGSEQFAIGHAQAWLENGFEAERQKLFLEQKDIIKGALAKYLK
ncbi:putative short-chain dehydrogenase/oxidoreductase [Whalleya microplaca]|nr:putative short-chain dehydrogenase/oxidoreductase [Whalleya microplaca]